MGRGFYYHLKIVAAVHIAVLVVLMLYGILPNMFKEKPMETIPVDFVVDVTPQPEPEAPEVVAPTPPEPPPPRKRPKIERSRVKVRRKVDAPPRPRLTEEEIRKRLLAGARPGDRSTLSRETADRDFRLIYEVFYQAWTQPSLEAVGDSATTAAIRLDGEGRILERSLKKPSGNAVMDASVMQALNAVTVIRGLSPSFLANHSVVTVVFELE